jgi:hypothetical protein
MNGILPIEKEDTMQEIRDEDLPVLPYRSKGKETINIKEHLKEKSEKELKNKNSVEKVLNKDVIQSEDNKNKEDIIQIEEGIKENVMQVEDSEKENNILENKAKSEKSEVKKETETETETESEDKSKKEREPDFRQFNKEYDEMFPPSRPEDLT